VEGNLTEKQKDEIRRYIGKNLSHWHVPRLIGSVETMPYTAIGKVDYQALYDKSENAGKL
jgi:acyl-CoA synthetase (AMP-forming)/AMP-acid ligase II